MGSKGGLALLGLLLVLAVLCHSGHSLKCYQCPKNTPRCDTEEECVNDRDACMSVAAAAGVNTYFKCWKKKDCTYQAISAALGESELKYECCERDLCNTDLPSGAVPVASGKTVLLLVPLLAAAWNLCL